MHSTESRELSSEERTKLQLQDRRLVSGHQAEKLELHAKRYWDLFYKRNERRFFKDRHWTAREFKELCNDSENSYMPKVMLEVGCGVGNLIFPLIEEVKMFVYACDLSPRAIEFVKSHPSYNENTIKAFQCDITTDDISKEIELESIDIVTLIFVLSAIHPNKFHQTLLKVFTVLKPGGIVLFRDYGLYDMAQLRFKAGHKISDNFYMRQDGTRSYYFSSELLGNLFVEAGFEIISNTYIHRRTINKKEDLNVPRIFVQGKFQKPS
ncbi:methyltransferase-like protein 6 [Zootermopsis nevadensis]|uniref:tRNA N(3)-methylcytidine methyltransferase n=1 Tax=Zootermopsis nevadensis TaxID=136037 RepID=A0A067RUK3_ZOONE|nr:methyltransferase-like protein 6 [Zootermopsis nevadensis]XP_021934529.1 methyltransferase-like protein 6 [Zootermopsis nevadensis]KDR23519.1 Methyltransferase-like protein 6 [Zootermopsis nevadensis]